MRETSSVRTVLTKKPDVAAEFIRNGGVVAFPTETVYGLGANVFDEAAVQKIFEAKQRPSDNPLIAHISSIDQVTQVASQITSSAKQLINKFFPGPLTVVLKKRQQVPLLATAGLDSIGIRMPKNKTANEFLNACGVPVVAPSANLSGRPSPTTWQAVHEDLNGRIDCILQGDPTEIGLESTVVDCRSGIPIILRSGAVSLEEIRSLVPETELLQPGENDRTRSPGLKHKHYAPKAMVVVLQEIVPTGGSAPRAFIGLKKPQGEFDLFRIVSGVEEYAHELFEFFRECDRRGVETIYCEPMPTDGIGAALMDRIRRASLAGD